MRPYEAYCTLLGTTPPPPTSPLPCRPMRGVASRPPGLSPSGSTLWGRCQEASRPLLGTSEVLNPYTWALGEGPPLGTGDRRRRGGLEATVLLGTS